MSYAKAMKHVRNHRKDRYTQPVLGMPFDDLKEGEHIESYKSIADRTATGFNIRIRNDKNEEFKQITDEFPTEDEAVRYCVDNDLDSKYTWVRIYSTEGMHVSGW